MPDRNYEAEEGMNYAHIEHQDGSVSHLAPDKIDESLANLRSKVTYVATGSQTDPGGWEAFVKWANSLPTRYCDKIKVVASDKSFLNSDSTELLKQLQRSLRQYPPQDEALDTVLTLIKGLGNG